MSTVATLLKTLVDHDPTRPLITFYDQRTGERTELSGTTVDNWVAKTANLLVDGCGLGAGDTAAVWLPPHWQTAVVLLGCWSAGVTVAFGATDGAQAQVAFAAQEAIAAAPTDLAAHADERFALGLAPLGQPMTEVPTGWSDYITEVRGHGDRFAGPAAGSGTPAWVCSDERVIDQGELCGMAAEHAAELGLRRGHRVLFDCDAHPSPVEWLLAPLAAGASTVLVVGVDGEVAGLAETERADLVGPA